MLERSGYESLGPCSIGTGGLKSLLFYSIIIVIVSIFPRCIVRLTHHSVIVTKPLREEGDETKYTVYWRVSESDVNIAPYVYLTDRLAHTT